MDIWRGKWQFKNSRSHLDGKSEMMSVSAQTEDEARIEIKNRVSRRLCGSMSMQVYIQVTELINVSKKVG